MRPLKNERERERDPIQTLGIRKQSERREEKEGELFKHKERSS